MLKSSQPSLPFILDYWPATLFLPSVLLLIAALALITRWWDRRDAAPAQGSYSAGLSVGGSHAPVVKSWRRASSLSSPHLVAVSR